MSDPGLPAADIIFNEVCVLVTAAFGNVFKLTPPAPGRANWTISVLYDFHKWRVGHQFPGCSKPLDPLSLPRKRCFFLLVSQSLLFIGLVKRQVSGLRRQLFQHPLTN